MVNTLSDEEWLKAVRTLLHAGEKDNIHLVSVELVGEPEGLIGAVQAVRVRVRQAQSNDVRRVGLFLKTLPKDPARAALAADSRAFHKESGLFALLARLTPRLRTGALQPWGARCLHARHPHLLLFEDLADEGFKTLGARTALDFAHCAAALDALARLHAASIALEEADRRARRITPWRLGDRFPDPLQEVMFSNDLPDCPTLQFVASGLEVVRVLLGKVHQFSDSPRYAEIQRRLDDLPNIGSDLTKTSDEHRNVICHGDLCVSNILFRYSSWGQVEEARLVDLQLTRYAPPALDVSALLHLCARKELREARGDELRDLYHAALVRALATAGFPASEELLTRSAFDKAWNDCATFGAIAAAVALPVALLPAEVLRAQREDPHRLRSFFIEDRTDIVVEVFERDADYRDRVREVLSDLVHMVLLHK